MVRRSYFEAPEAFSLSPLLSLLPVCGSVSDLERLRNSLYARYERVQNQRVSLKESEAGGLGRQTAAEEAMLKVVLEWLAVNTGGLDSE